MEYARRVLNRDRMQAQLDLENDALRREKGRKAAAAEIAEIERKCQNFRTEEGWGDD